MNPEENKFLSTELNNIPMSLVNQSHRLIAILLQSPLYKQKKYKIEDLVTIRKKLSSSIDPFTHSIGSIAPIKKLCFVIS